MTIREVINILIDAPNKDKPFIIECRKDVLKNHNYEWGISRDSQNRNRLTGR